MTKITGDINKHMMRDAHARLINGPAMDLIADILEKHTAAILEGAREKMEQAKARRKADEALMQQALDALHEIHWSNDSQWQSERAAPLIDLLKERLK